MVEGSFEGMPFSQFFNLIGGETLLFQHCGAFQFDVKIFDIYGCEIDYASMPKKHEDFGGM